nr:TnsA-like heteromeric transposase endonuclease subunit [Kineococcus siccus]
MCFIADDGTARIATPLDAGDIAFEVVAPVRAFPTWPHKRSYDGWWWAATTGRSIGYESWLERDHLMLFDHDPDVTGIASQPFWIMFEDAAGAVRGDEGRVSRGPSHAPDFFLRLRDGSGVVVDVRPLARLDAATEQVFDRTKRLCQQLGWQYRVCTDLDVVHARNVRWLAGYRHPRFGTDPAMVAALSDTFRSPLPLADGLRACGDGLQWPAVLYHLLWRQVLTYEQYLPLSDTSLITTALNSPQRAR